MREIANSYRICNDILVPSAYPKEVVQGIHMLNIYGYLHPLSRNKSVHVLKYMIYWINHEFIRGKMLEINDHSLYERRASMAMELKKRGEIAIIMNVWEAKVGIGIYHKCISYGNDRRRGESDIAIIVIGCPYLMVWHNGSMTVMDNDWCHHPLIQTWKDSSFIVTYAGK